MKVRASFSSWFIYHPIPTVLLTVAVVLLGAVAYPLLSIAPLPDVDFPTINVQALLPGASAETMASSVATPIEVQLSAVPGITEMTSSSALGATSISLQFSLDKNIDTAALEVQAALNAAQGQLPRAMPSAPTWRKLNPNDPPVVVFSVYSDLLTLTALEDATEELLVRPLSQLPGVGQVLLNGQQRPALRIQAAPAKLAAYGLTLEDLRQAITATSVNEPKGALYGTRQMSTLDTNDQIFRPEQYRQLIVAYRNGRPVQLGDVARVVTAAQDAYQASWQDGHAGLQMVIFRQPGANVVATAQRVTAALPALEKALPASVHVTVIDDPPRTIRAALQDVDITLAVSVVLVVLVMSLFLRETAATLIVASVLCVSLLATIAVMYAFGFSLNNLTLVALVIAVGFIVDDAIVVIENIHRYLESGQSRLEAAIKGAAEIGFTVITIAFSLIAAFIPLLLMSGIVGRLFREFALTVTGGILVSVLTALTLAPMLASRYMRPPPHAEKPADLESDGHPPRSGFAGWLMAHYARSLDWVLGHQSWVLAAFAATVAASIFAYVLIPKGFFPEEDISMVFGATQAAEDISYPEMAAKQQAVARLIAADPAVDHYASRIGSGGFGGSLSQGGLIITLKPPSERDVSADGFIDRVRPKLEAIPGIMTFMRAGQDINLSAFGGRAQYVYTLRSTDSKVLYDWAPRLAQALQGRPQLRDVSSDLQLGARVTSIRIDRAAAGRFGISTDDLDQMLYDAYGQRQVVQYQTQTNQYYVVLEIDPSLRGRPDSLNYLYFRSPLTGQMVPLRAVAHIQPPEQAPLAVNHIGMFPAVNISFNLAPGVALSQAVDVIQRTQEALRMPGSITGVCLGNARAFQDSLRTMPLLIIAALVSVYIILGVLYESFVHPLTILSTLPSAGIGALLLLWITRLNFSIMAFIGIVLLIGIVKKNGILMVDFALDSQRRLGLSPLQAVRRACLVRFRPIMMTTIAAMLAAVPIMIAFGVGAELRQPLGVAVFGGLLFSQALTLFTTPVIYLTLDRTFHPRAHLAEHPMQPGMPGEASSPRVAS
jgi:HAE1 family hydrophobic/amphiphilic exporter-1